MNSIRRIAHLDMDAFFASVELLCHPELRRQAVVVGGRNIHQPVAQPDGTKRFARLCARRQTQNMVDGVDTFDDVISKMRRDAKATARPKASRLVQARRELRIL